MQDADGYGFEEAGRTFELSPPASGLPHAHISFRSVTGGPTLPHHALSPSYPDLFRVSMRPSGGSGGGRYPEQVRV